MGFRVVKGDLFEQKVDAIVIPSQPSLALEGAVGGKAKELCGKRLELELEQCKKIQFGECVIANSYCDNFAKVILVANPRWIDGDHEELENLEISYYNCLLKAKAFGLRSIAFPLLSTGAYKFPRPDAINVAHFAINKFFRKNSDNLDILMVTPDDELLAAIQTPEKSRAFYQWYNEKAVDVNLAGTAEETFAQVLSYFVISCGKVKRHCYETIVSKTMFNNYLNGVSVPKKYTAVALGVQMRLSPEEINELVAPLGEQFGPSVTADKVIIDEMKREPDYTIDSLNDVLKKKNFPLLGSK